MDLLQYESYADIKDDGLSPPQIIYWENLILQKQEIDNLINNIKQQITEYKNLGVNYFILIDDVEDNELKKYIMDNYNMLLYILNEKLSIPDLDNKTKDEIYNIFRILYKYLFGYGYNELYSSMTILPLYDLYKRRYYDDIKRILLNFYTKIYNKLQEIIKGLDAKDANIISDTLSEYDLIIKVISSSDSYIISKMMYNMGLIIVD